MDGKGLDLTDTVILVCGGFGLLYIAWEGSLQYVDWVGFGIKVAEVLASITVLCFVTYFLIRTLKRRKAERNAKKDFLEGQERELLSALDTTFSWYSSEEALKKYVEIKKFITTLPDEVTFKHEDDIFEFYDKTEAVIRDIERKEHQQWAERQKKKKAEEQEKQDFKRQVEELFEFKKAEKSRHALPLNHNYSVHVIHEAELEAEEHLDWLKRAKRVRKEAIEYYKTHGLHTKPDLPDCDEQIYADIRKEIQEGKIPIKETIEYSGTPLDKKFYRAKGLSEYIKKQAAAQGYEYVKGVELDGRPCAGGFYIKKNFEKESNAHFIAKNLFAELHPKIQIEYCTDNKRVDAVFINNKIRLGIEIETGTNKDDQLAIKIQWLNENFTKWIFVCPRKIAPKYGRLVDNEKSFCLTPKNAKEKVLDLIAPIKQR